MTFIFVLFSLTYSPAVSVVSFISHVLVIVVFLGIIVDLPHLHFVETQVSWNIPSFIFSDILTRRIIGVFGLLGTYTAHIYVGGSKVD